MVMMGDMEVYLPLEKLCCPICTDIFNGRIYQCRNGHLICQQCLSNETIKNCPTCRILMETEGINLFRSLGMEELIDFATMTCPFRENGCQEKMKLKDQKNHLKDCAANTHKINVCRILGYNCDYEANAYDATATKMHLTKNHGVHMAKTKEISVGIGDDLSQLNKNSMNDGRWLPIIMTDEKQSILVVPFYKRLQDCVSIALINLDQDIFNQVGCTGIGSIKISNAEGEQVTIETSTKILSLLAAEKAFESPEICLDPLLLNGYRPPGGDIFIDITMMDADGSTGIVRVFILPPMEEITLRSSDNN